MSISKAPNGLTWGQYRTWYSKNIGKANIKIVSEAYQGYSGKVSQRRGRSVSPSRTKTSVPSKRSKSVPKKSVSPERQEKKKPSPKKKPILTNVRSPIRILSPKSKQEVPLPLKLTGRELCIRLKPYINREYDMSNLICSQLRNNKSNWVQILDLISTCKPAVKCDSCTNVGFRIAKSLIRVAATRVFAEPEQSIVELPVNSIDAYNPKRKIGKFGLGFFSDLYWLVGHPNRFLGLTSTYRHTSGYCNFSVRIQEIDGLLAFRILHLDELQGKDITTGLNVVIDASKDPFLDNTVSLFLEHLERLRYVNDASIKVTDERSGKEILLGNMSLRNKSPINPVVINISTLKVNVEDNATGVSLEALFGSLFVPSISTKTIQLSQSSVSEPVKSSIYSTDPSEDARFMILVGRISIVNILSTWRLKGTNYVVDLPLNTRVPVSRDDVILTLETKRIMREGILDLFEQTKARKDVSRLQTLLDQYIEYTSNPENKEVVRETMETFYINNKKILIPYTHYFVYKKWPILIPSLRYDIRDVEEWLDKNTKPQTDIWYGVKVLILDVPEVRKVTNGELISYLFIDETYKNSLGKNWVQSITTSYFETKLYPYTSTYGEDEYKKFDNVVGGLEKALYANKGTKTTRGSSKLRPSDIIDDPISLRLLFSVLLKLNSLSIYFNMTEIHIVEHIIAKLCGVYIYMRDSFSNICNALLRKFSSFKGNQTYGGDKYFLSAIQGYLIYNEIDVRELGNKIIPFLTDNILYTIDSIKESSYVHIRFTFLSPYTLKQSFKSNPRQNGISGLYFDAVCQQSTNYIELLMLCLGAGVGFLSSLFHQINMERYIETIPLFVGDMLNRVRGRQYTAYYVTILLQQDVSIHRYNDSYPELTRDGFLAEEWIKRLSNVNTLTLSSVTVLTDPNKFRLSKELRYLFKNELQTDTDKFLRDIQEEKEDDNSPLQVIEIAINEGTVKPFIEATMTELTQNSIDAIREFNPKDKIIDINLNKDKDSQDLILSITDHVGMSSDAFVYVGIPFLSTKSPSELVTGEIGSGFFNAYRESSLVSIDSVREGVYRAQRDTPIRDKNNRVIDIDRQTKIVNSKTREPNKTDITVTIPTTSTLEFANTVSRVEYTATRVLSLAITPGIRYNGTLLNIEKILVYEIGFLQLYMTDPKKSIIHESYLLTKGVPFQPLPNYTKHILLYAIGNYQDENFVVNITHGGYTPVQTRTKIRLSPMVETDFKTLCVNLLFIAILRRVYNNKDVQMLDHFYSDADVRQLRFSRYNAIINPSYISFHDSNALKYVSFEGKPTLTELINKCIDVMQDKMYENVRRELSDLIDKEYTTKYPEVDKMVKDVALKWLSSKNRRHTVIVSNSEIEKKKNEEYKSEPYNLMQGLIYAWITTYWNIAKKMKVQGYNRKIPKIYSVASDKPASGWYDPSDDSITINFGVKNTLIDKFNEDILKVLRKKNIDLIETKLKKNRMWELFFLYSFPSSTIPHELEHARRKGSHEQGGHDSTNTKLYPDDSVQTRTFDQAANGIYQLVLSEGFYEELFKETY